VAAIPRQETIKPSHLWRPHVTGKKKTKIAEDRRREVGKRKEVVVGLSTKMGGARRPGEKRERKDKSTVFNYQKKKRKQ